MSLVREPAVSGSFYPDNPKVLRRTIESYLENAEIPHIESDPVGILSPHAGYMYSGQVAAYGYKTLIGREYDTVIIIGPSHRAYFDGLALMEKGGYKTPLGVVKVDEDMASEILRLGSHIFISNFRAHLGEHSLEVQLPFLQVVLREFKILPILMGAQNRATWREAASVIGKVCEGARKRILFLGSTDLSHYYPYEKAVKLDSLVIKHAEAFDIEGMERDYESEAFEACGGGPMIAVMILSKMRGAKKGVVLKYANSGDTSGDRSQVVGYLSAVFLE